MKFTLGIIAAVIAAPPILIAFSFYIAWCGDTMLKLFN